MGAFIFNMLLAFFLDGVMPNLFRWFIPFFMIGVIVIFAASFIDDKSYYITLFVFGFLYDHFFFETVFLNAFTFLLIGYLAKMLLKKRHDFLNKVLTYYLVSICYVLVLLLFTIFYVKYDFMILFSKLFNSLFLNTIYFCIIFLFHTGYDEITNHK